MFDMSRTMVADDDALLEAGEDDVDWRISPAHFRHGLSSKSHRPARMTFLPPFRRARHSARITARFLSIRRAPRRSRGRHSSSAGLLLYLSFALSCRRHTASSARGVVEIMRASMRAAEDARSRVGARAARTRRRIAVLPYHFTQSSSRASEYDGLAPPAATARHYTDMPHSLQYRSHDRYDSRLPGYYYRCRLSYQDA